MDKQTLIKVLNFAYGNLIASVPLLSCAMSRAEHGLWEYYAKHRDEEAGHDEMLLEDLHNLGVEPELSHYSAQFAGSQYYLIYHEHPALLLGYMHALESNTMPIEEVDKLSQELGVELTCLKHHALHDPDHKQDLDRMIAGLDPELRERVLWNERNTLDMLMNARL